MYLERFAHLWYWRKRCFSETPNRLRSFLALDVIPWCTWETKIVSLCQTGDSCSARKEDNARLPEQRAHGCPLTSVSAALESHPKTAHAKTAEASLFFSPAHLQPPAGAAGLLSALGSNLSRGSFRTNRVRQARLLYLRVWAYMKISKRQQTDVLPPATKTLSKIHCLTSVSIGSPLL